MITETQINQYIDHIKADYLTFFRTDSNPEVKDKMVSDFNSSFKVLDGKSYIKIAAHGSVHSFIVKADGGKFKAGDILKPASWQAPAKNFARGNVITGDYKSIRWTSAG